MTSIHDTVDDAYARLDAISEKLQRDGAPPDTLGLCVVDTDRQPVARPWAQCPWLRSSSSSTSLIVRGYEMRRLECSWVA